MPSTLMQFKAHLPAELSRQRGREVSIVAEEPDGSRCALPARFECVAELVEGILLFETEMEGEVYAAVDMRMLPAGGKAPFALIRQALLGLAAGSPLGPGPAVCMDLHGEGRFVRSVMARLNADFHLRFATYQHEA
jgi:F-type H+-transporting ATPase subunit epsilon